MMVVVVMVDFLIYFLKSPQNLGPNVNRPHIYARSPKLQHAIQIHMHTAHLTLMVHLPQVYVMVVEVTVCKLILNTKYILGRTIQSLQLKPT